MTFMQYVIARRFAQLTEQAGQRVLTEREAHALNYLCKIVERFEAEETAIHSPANPNPPDQSAQGQEKGSSNVRKNRQ